MTKVLVVTNPKDPHSDAVISRLYQLGVGVVRLHPADSNADISISISSSSTWVEIHSSGRAFNAADISSVWFRRPNPINFASRHLPEPDRRLVTQETNATLWGLYGRVDAVWISHPYNLRRASWKVFQLEVCRRVGMQCPAYVVSNDTRVLKRFAESHNELVLKPLHEQTTCFESDGTNYALYVKRFTCPELAELFEQRPLSPVMLQQYIRKQCDIRVTVIGEKIFPVMIRSPDERDEVVDFRPRCLEMKHEVLECPVALTKSILSYRDTMGLNFAAFDFALDHEGRWHVLECNPNGQWLWLEVVTGLPMVDTLARHLALIDRCPVRRGQLMPN
jgi:glutathione synthase/RimK-type ligase-like ATP-grasp enzyme